MPVDWKCSSLRWPLLAVGEPAALVATDLAAGRSYAQDDVEVTHRIARAAPSGRYEVVLIVSRDRAPRAGGNRLSGERRRFVRFTPAGVLRIESQTHQFVERGLEIRLQCGPLSRGGDRCFRRRSSRRCCG